MHRLFREALNDAVGLSQFIIAVIIDIREFSPFSLRCESPETAMFIKRVYMKLIDSYFPFASFYKSTGDGLLLTIPFDESNLKEVARSVISSCIACHRQFGAICKGDPMIPFKVPHKIGIGVARGPACCLRSGDITIDYSGRLLNLTSRLTDLASPSGIVIDGAFDISLLTPKQRSIFVEDNVYLTGIHEADPIKIYFTPEFTEIPKYNKRPIAPEAWRNLTDVQTLGHLLKLSSFKYSLPSEAASPAAVEVEIQHPKIINGAVIAEVASYVKFKQFQYLLDRGKPVVIVDFPNLCQLLKAAQVKEDMEVTISIDYVEK